MVGLVQSPVVGEEEVWNLLDQYSKKDCHGKNYPCYIPDTLQEGLIGMKLVLRMDVG